MIDLQVEPILTMAAGLSVQSVFMMSSFRDPDMVTARESLISNHGDSFSLCSYVSSGCGIEMTRLPLRMRAIET